MRCGFRLDSINKDYFPRNYHAPLYENSLQCLDQVVLRYRIFCQAERDGITERFWKKFVESHGEYEGRSYEAWHFCYGESLPNKLLGLVREGRKRGTSSALELYEEAGKIFTEDIPVLFERFELIYDADNKANI